MSDLKKRVYSDDNTTTKDQKINVLQKVKDFTEKNKSKIIMIIAALISFVTSFEIFGGKAAVYCTIIVAFLELLMYYIKNGLTETFLNMCVNTVMLIVNTINGQYTIEKTITVEKASRDNESSTKKQRKKVSVCFLTKDMVEEFILHNKPINDTKES